MLLRTRAGMQLVRGSGPPSRNGMYLQRDDHRSSDISASGNDTPGVIDHFSHEDSVANLHSGARAISSGQVTLTPTYNPELEARRPWGDTTSGTFVFGPYDSPYNQPPEWAHRSSILAHIMVQWGCAVLVGGFKRPPATVTFAAKSRSEAHMQRQKVQPGGLKSGQQATLLWQALHDPDLSVGDTSSSSCSGGSVWCELNTTWTQRQRLAPSPPKSRCICLDTWPL